MIGCRSTRLVVFLRVWAWVFVAGSAVPTLANAAPGDQEEKRKSLQDKLGIPTSPPPPSEEPQPPSDDSDLDEGEDEFEEDAPSGEDEPSPSGRSDDASNPGAEPRKPVTTYSGRVHRLMQSGCANCHKQGAMAGNTGFVLSGSVADDYKATRRFVNKGQPKSSALLTKGAGKSHGGGAPYPEGSSAYATILTWIEDGAVRGGGGKASASPVTPPVVAPVPPTEPPPASKPTARKAAPRETPPPSTPEAGLSPEAPSAEPAAAFAAEEAQPVDPFVPVHAILVNKCAACHAPGKPAGSAGFIVTGELEPDRTNTLSQVDLSAPASSVLLTKGAGQMHGGGAVVPEGSTEYQMILDWIAAGAAGPAVATSDEDGGELQVDAMSGASMRSPSARLGDGTPLPQETFGSRIPYSLPWNLRINGRFDFSYERRNVKNQPFSKGGKNAFATYHHFLFISRSGAKDPFGFNVELITQQFFEFNARFVHRKSGIQFLVKAGKILIPFGEEPLFHSSYGGRTGFDQELLPVVWSMPGIAFNINIPAGPLAISNDLYIAQGHQLRSPDAVINLQSDFSPLDDVNIAVGDRIGLSILPFTAWYSFQLTPVDYGRLLFMQALDIEFWRWPGVPFVKNLVVGIGAMRADVSGGDVGGSGNDYYHFGSYGYARYYFIPQLYLQYRGGLKTFDNRRGVYFDDTRIDERDRGSHNVTLMGRFKGFYAMVQFFWNLEKANEQDDDFLRLTVGYEF